MAIDAMDPDEGAAARERGEGEAACDNAAGEAFDLGAFWVCSEIRSASVSSPTDRSAERAWPWLALSKNAEDRATKDAP